MPLHRFVLLANIIGCIVIGSSGCVMQRTVKDGDAVVARGYVVKAPIIGE